MKVVKAETISLILGIVFGLAIGSIFFPWHSNPSQTPEERYEQCRSKFLVETDCFNNNDASLCLDLIEQKCGQP